MAPRCFCALRDCCTFLLAVALLAVAGCSGGGIRKVTVHGTVTYQGQPLQAGLLKFSGPEGAYAAGRIQADGKYIITDVLPGETKVGVLQTPQGAGSSSNAAAASRSSTPAALPEKYRDPSTSGLTYTITPDTTELDIAIP
jgi:hypothetical protein